MDRYGSRMPRRVAIAGGAGGVGSSLAFNLLLHPEPFDVVVVDRRPEKVRSHVMDLEQVLALGSGRSVRAGGVEELAGADVAVVCAATPLTANTSRRVYLHANAAIVAELADRLEGWPGVLVMITNPVDPLCTLAHRLLGGDRRRVLGYTLNDSLRLRTAVGAALGVPAGAVDAWVLGEHGDGAVPIFSRVGAHGAPVTLTAPQRDAAEAFVRTWYQRHVALDSGRSSTWTSGAGAARMVAALAGGDPAPWVAAVTLAGEYGVDGVALTVPVRLGPGGAEEILDWELDAGERTAMQHAADAVRTAVDSLSL
jgi:malate/lactate dehydrogenase